MRTFRSFPVSELVSNATLTFEFSSNVVIVLKCCSASNSVGAISAACALQVTAMSIACNATTVFPEPTSPCSRRFIGVVVVISPAISSMTCCWESVSVKGIRASIRLLICSFQASFGACIVSRRWCLFIITPSCRSNNSSYPMRRRPSFAWSRVSGLWHILYASERFGIANSRSISCVRWSSISGSASSITSAIFFAITLDERCSLAL